MRALGRFRPNCRYRWLESRWDMPNMDSYLRVCGTEGEPHFWLNAAARLRRVGDRQGSQACKIRATQTRIKLWGKGNT